MKTALQLAILFLLFTQPLLAKTPDTKTKFTIFSGDKQASFFAVASGLCNVFNRHYAQEKYECLAVESKGAEKNLRSLVAQEADLGIIKNSEFNQFFIKDFSELADQTDFVARIHDEYLTILAQKNLKIKSLSDLNNKSVNLGSIGSSSTLVVEKYFSNFSVQPKNIYHFGAAESFKMLCDKKIDAWVYFVGHPNKNFDEVLRKCDLEIVSLPKNEVNNFLSFAPFFSEEKISRETYDLLSQDISTIYSPTILVARKRFDSNITKLIQEIIANHKEELVKENRIFKSFKTL